MTFPDRDTLTYEPCTECGEQSFRQETNQVEDVVVDDEGIIADIIVNDATQVQTLWCKTCDEILWEADE
jgi:hypothetical protein